MKRNIILVLMIFLLCSLMGCNSTQNTQTKKDLENVVSDEGAVEKNQENNNSDEMENDSNLYLTENDLNITIGDITINYNMTKRDIINSLGEPIEIKTYENSSEYKTYKYNGVDITFVEDFIEVIQVVDNKYPTNRGICVGDSIEKVFEKYGYIEPLDVQADEKYYLYTLKQDIFEIHLFFVEEDDIIKEYYFCNGL